MLTNYRALTRVFTKMNPMDEPKDRGRKIKNLTLGIFALVFIMIPVAAASGFFTYFLTKELAVMGAETLGIQLMFGFISIFTVMFGISVIFNELYFSTDIDHILPLPLRGWEMAASKFTAVFLGENVMQFIMVLACTIGYGIATKMSVLQWITSLIQGFLMPLAPMAVCAILGILIMTFTRFIKSKETVRRITLVFVLLVMAGMAFALMSLSSFDLDNFILDVAKEDITFVRVLKVLFPQLILMANSMAVSGGVGAVLLNFLGYMAITAGLLAVFLFIAEKFYIRSVSDLSEGDAKVKKTSEKSFQTLKMRSPAGALFRKEVHELVRHQAFFTNCILVNFIWPIFVFVVAKIMNISFARDVIATKFELSVAENRFNHPTLIGGETGGNYAIYVLIFAFAITVIMTSMNSLGSNAFSREGQNIDFMKYIPVSLRTQWKAKARVSLVFSSLGTIPYMLIFAIYAKMPILATIVMLEIQVLSVILVTYMGMLLDSINPKLEWEDALSALRENYNTFFCMGISILIAAVGGVGMYIAFAKVGLCFYGAGTILVFLLGIADIFIYRRCMTKGIENLREVGEI